MGGVVMRRNGRSGQEEDHNRGTPKINVNQFLGVNIIISNITSLQGCVLRQAQEVSSVT